MNDYISREALLEHLNRFAPEKYDALVNDLIRREPAADVRPVVRGKWIQKPFLLGTTNVCSRCESYYGMPHETYNYCPNCGADMRGGSDND